MSNNIPARRIRMEIRLLDGRIAFGEGTNYTLLLKALLDELNIHYLPKGAVLNVFRET